MPSVSINGKSVFYTIDQIDDNPAKTTALLIHGLGSSSCFYKTITPSLKSTARCISLDTPGSGLSGLGNSEQSISSIARDIIGLLDELQIREKIVVVGHSMGGIIANYIAAEHPDRVKGVVLIGPVNPVPAMADVFSKRIEVVKKGSYFHPILDFNVGDRMINVLQMDWRPLQTPFPQVQQGRKPTPSSMLSSEV
jgi:pimeloyl-ACP methyl ester carboxylesterase